MDTEKIYNKELITWIICLILSIVIVGQLDVISFTIFVVILTILFRIGFYFIKQLLDTIL